MLDADGSNVTNFFRPNWRMSDPALSGNIQFVYAKKVGELCDRGSLGFLGNGPLFMERSRLSRIAFCAS